MISAGRLDSYVTFQKKSGSEGNYGTEYTWSDYIQVWGNFKELTGNDFWAAQANNVEVTGILEIRYRNDIKADMRIKHDGKIYEIDSVVDPNKRKESLIIRLSG